jgi:hypothetical protein
VLQVLKTEDGASEKKTGFRKSNFLLSVKPSDKVCITAITALF